jgi:cellulose synthase/poly-beta-1,6-N-acetylglucosamine synthase-like glycosyltransferase
MTLQGIAGASVSKRFHTMCNGANIAYSKKAFDEVQGFAGIDSLPTGDDMLLMHKIFKRYPDGVVWLKSREAIVTTKACPTWHAFFQQRIRWASKAAYYDDKRILWVLLLVYLLNAALLLAALATIFLNLALWPLLFWLLVKTIVELVFLLPVAHFFGSNKWLQVFPLLQPVHIVYTVVAGWLGRFGSYQWKGRVVKKPAELVK